MRKKWVILLALFAIEVNANPVADSLFQQNLHQPDSIKISRYLEVAGSLENRDYITCLKISDEAIRLCKKNGDLFHEAEATLIKGLCNYFAGEYDQALTHYLSAIKQFETSNQLTGKARVLNELGVFYRRQKNEADGDRCFEEAYSIAAQHGDEKIMATSLNNQGVSAQDNGQHRKAIEYFNQSRKLLEKNNDSIGISYALDYSSVSYAAMGDFQQAHSLQTGAYGIRMRLKDSSAAAMSLVNLAELEFMQHHTNDAKQYFLQGLQISEKTNSKDLTAYCYKQLADVFSQEGNHREAYGYHVKYSVLNEEIFNEKRSRQINELQTRYETEKKTRQIDLLTKENELKETRHRNQRNLFIALLALLTVFALAYYNYFRHKKQKEIDDAMLLEKDLRNNAIIEAEEKERIRIARDLHDGVAQTMVAAKMQLESFIENSAMNLNEQTTLKNAFDLVKDASDEVRAISHSMVPNALLKSGLVAAIRDFVQRMGNDKLKINLDIHGLNQRLNENIETVIFRVLQELVNNIIKHAQASEITIQLIRDTTELTFTVEDNGIGFDTTKLNKKAGMGIKNISSRIEYLHGTVVFDSTPGNGTTVIIEIPLTDDHSNEALNLN